MEFCSGYHADVYGGASSQEPWRGRKSQTDNDEWRLYPADLAGYDQGENATGNADQFGRCHGSVYLVHLLSDHQSGEGMEDSAIWNAAE